jgi:hypothetical protein
VRVLELFGLRGLVIFELALSEGLLASSERAGGGGATF